MTMNRHLVDAYDSRRRSGKVQSWLGRCKDRVPQHDQVQSNLTFIFDFGSIPIQTQHVFPATPHSPLDSLCERSQRLRLLVHRRAGVGVLEHSTIHAERALQRLLALRPAQRINASQDLTEAGVAEERAYRRRRRDRLVLVEL